MNETLVYDAARDAAGGLFTIDNIATACIVVGFALISIPTIQSIRRNPERRVRGLIGLGTVALIAFGFLFGLRTLNAATMRNAHTENIEGVIGSITPKLLTVGGIKVMYSCASTANCPGVSVGDMARVAIVDDDGPETSALASKIWKLPAAPRRR